MTYRELLEQLQMLSAERLDQKVFYMGFNGGGEILLLESTSEDYVDVGEGYEPVSGFDETPEMDNSVRANFAEARADIAAGTYPILKTGTLILWEEGQDDDEADDTADEG